VKTKNGHAHYTDLHDPYWLHRLAFTGKDVDWRNPQAYFETDVKNMNFDTLAYRGTAVLIFLSSLS